MYADMDAGTKRRLIDCLLGQQEDLRLELKAILRLLEQSESDRSVLSQALGKANERMEVLTGQLQSTQKSQRKSEHQAQKYRVLWEREKGERYGKVRRKASATVTRKEVPAEAAGGSPDDGHGYIGQLFVFER